MFALVDKSDNSITRMLSGNKGITIGDNQYPKAIFNLWSEAERNAINIYAVTIDNSKKKALELVSEACEAISGFKDRSRNLCQIANFIVSRQF